MCRVKFCVLKRCSIAILASFLCVSALWAKIDRKAWVTRHNPHLTTLDTLSSLSVGNGEFAFTCDVTGLQTFHQLYSHGVPLGTMAQWGWHSFPNTENFQPGEVLRMYDFGRGHEECYSCQLKDERGKAASDYLRANPHRLHLGVVTFKGMDWRDISDIDQTLDLWNGELQSSYKCNGVPVKVLTTCDPARDCVVARIHDSRKHPVCILFPYPTGKHSDDACDWTAGKPHSVQLVSQKGDATLFSHTLDGQTYYVRVECENAAMPRLADGCVEIVPVADDWLVSVEFLKNASDASSFDTAESVASTHRYWNEYWQQGGAVDFSHCTDARAHELERRVVLSLYLLAIQCAGSTPPQETGLTYNSWFGKYHLEMIWWHQSHFALWGHPEMLARTLPWYDKALPMARQIAQRQGFDGVRWMKMTDPSAAEAPSNVGSFLIWQQPHVIYLCELLYRATGDENVLRKYGSIVQQTAEFMASFVSYDEAHQRYVLKGCIPAQETLKAAETINPPFELSYWHFALNTAQEWRKRLGLPPDEKWNEIIENLSPLCAKDGVYAAAETALSYPSLKPLSSESDSQPFEASELPENIKLYSDHMAVLAACGVLPKSPQFDLHTMSNTLHWVMQNWNWDKTWGWDFPTTCMTAVRTGEPHLAVNALLQHCRTNTYLQNGHNYQDARLRCYLPGNGGLLTAVALMCAGYDGCTEPLPGFPKDGKWDVRFEGISPLP